MQADYVYQTQAALDELLGQQPALMLWVRETTLWWSSEVVYEEEDIDGGLVVSLAREGLEHLTFYRGIEAEELQRLAAVLSTVTATEVTGEVAVRLWCLDAPNFRYGVRDPFDPISPTPRGLSAEHDQYRQLVLQVTDLAGASEPVAETLAGWAPPPLLPWIDALEADLGERRRQLASHDDLGPLMARASILLLGALGAEAEPKSDTPAWRLLTELLRAVVGHGHFADAQSLLDRMDDYGHRTASPNVRRMFEGVRRWLGSEDVMRPVMTIIGQTTEPARLQAAMRYLARLGPHADASLWKLAGQLRSDVARHQVAELLVSAVERDPEETLRQLPKQNPAMMIDLVARAELRRSAEADVVWWHGLEHRDPAVRAPATKLLRRRDGDNAEAVLLQRLDDEDPQVRMSAIDAIGGRPRQALLDRIQTYFKLGRMEAASEAELGLAMVTFARILGPRAVPQLSHVLNEGHRLRLGVKTVPIQVKAAQVLGGIPDSSAVKALQLGLQSRNPQVKSTCQKAIDGYYGESLHLEPPPQADISPRPATMKRPAAARPSEPRSEGPRRLARGIVGLPAGGGKSD